MRRATEGAMCGAPATRRGAAAWRGLAAAAAVIAAAAGCAESIRPDRPDGGGPADAPAGSDAIVPTGPVTTVAHGDGTYTTLVDATSIEAWIHVDFEARAETDAAGPWDLRFQRFHVSTNGGVSGAAGVEVAPIPGAALAAVTAAPATGWIADAPDGADANLDPDYAFEQGDGWYAYDSDTHVLSPRPIVWVVRTSDGGFVKLALERYYDSAGTPAWLTFRWAPL